MGKSGGIVGWIGAIVTLRGDGWQGRNVSLGEIITRCADEMIGESGLSVNKADRARVVPLKAAHARLQE
jgi:hypothetical protein